MGGVEPKEFIFWLGYHLSPSPNVPAYLQTYSVVITRLGTKFWGIRAVAISLRNLFYFFFACNFPCNLKSHEGGWSGDIPVLQTFPKVDQEAPWGCMKREKERFVQTPPSKREAQQAQESPVYFITVWGSPRNSEIPNVKMSLDSCSIPATLLWITSVVPNLWQIRDSGIAQTNSVKCCKLSPILCLKHCRKEKVGPEIKWAFGEKEHVKYMFIP